MEVLDRLHYRHQSGERSEAQVYDELDDLLGRRSDFPEGFEHLSDHDYWIDLVFKHRDLVAIARHVFPVFPRVLDPFDLLQP